MPLSPHLAAVILFAPRPRKERKPQPVEARILPFPISARPQD